MPTETIKFTATLSNDSNKDPKASQGGYKSNSKKGATCTSRTGYFDFTGLNGLKGKAITGITWYLHYASSGADKMKIVTFTSPVITWTTSVYAYGKAETKTISSTGTFANLYSAIINAINGDGKLKLTMYNGENTTYFEDDEGGSYTQEYQHVDSSYFNITYITSLPSYIYTNIRSLKTYPEAGMTKDTSQNCTVSASSTYSNSYPAYLAFDYKDSTCWASSNTATGPYVMIQMPNALYDCTVTIKNRTHASYNIGGFISGRIDGSNDGINFTTLTTFSDRDGKTSGYQNSYTLNNNTTAYKYIRVKADTWDKSIGTYACIGEMRVTGYTIPSTGGWQEATAYIYHNGAWVAVAPSVYKDGQWLPS